MHDESADLPSPIWYKDAILYQLHVRTFYDSNGDGTGDFQGLTTQLDYIVSLGVNTLWIMPFFQSPGEDDGYDVVDYKSINPSYGTLDDFRNFVDAAHARGLRVIIELVLNHTSDKHPWFQRARRASHGSSGHRFYVWSDDDEQFSETRIIFKDTEDSNWTWDPVARCYYWHRFYEHQPDLNYRNPDVVEAMLDVMHFWLDFGVDGFRLDAVPYLLERAASTNESLPETHDVLKLVRKAIGQRDPTIVLLAEANQPPETVMEYFGNSDECQMAFHFPLMPQVFMAVAKADRQSVVSMVERTKDIPEDCQWVTFLRNHDELSLEMVSEKQREELWSIYAPDEEARINLGIRRRLAPLMDGDRQRLELINAVLLSLPGSPVLYYGDEIGMGDDLSLDDRDGVRTPMQWADTRNSGFSRSEPSLLTRPVIGAGPYGYRRVNVADQNEDPASLLNWFRRTLSIRSARICLGRGDCSFIDAGSPAVLTHIRACQDSALLCVFNLSNAQQIVTKPDLIDKVAGKIDLFTSAEIIALGSDRGALILRPYQYFWIDVSI